MKPSHKYEHFRSQVQPVLTSKLEEFSLLGYGKVKEEELWIFLEKKKWRKDDNSKRLSEVVQDILSVKIGEYFNYATVEAFKEAAFTFDDEDELRALLK